MNNNFTRPTLVMGGLSRIVAPVARSLHGHGIPVHGASLGAYRRPVRSKALESFTYLANWEEQPEEFFENLAGLIRAHGIDTVIPCGDEVLQALAPHDAALRQLVNYSGPSAEACRSVLDKKITLRMAVEQSIPVPAEYDIPDVTSLQRQRYDIGFPLVAKPRSKHAEALTGVKSLSLANFEALEAAYQRWPNFGEWFLIQEFLPGVGVGIETLMDKGEALVLYQHRRIREFPIRGGVSVVAQSEELDQRLVTYALDLLRALHWQGPAMVEFRQDPVTGRAGLMEINGRFWGSFALSREIGFDLPYYVWQLAHGERPAPPKTYKIGARTRWLAGDFERLVESAVKTAGGAQSVRTLASDTGDFLRDFLPPAKDAVWSWSDPSTALDENARCVLRMGLQVTRSAAQAVVPAGKYHLLKSLRRAGPRTALRYLTYRMRGVSAMRSAPSSIHSVAFVCYGNIIRSPMAQALFERIGGPHGMRVCSAGTHAIEGREADPRAVAVASEFGVSLAEHGASRLTSKTVAETDLLVVMDYLNYVAVLEAFPEADGKTILLGATEIPDPYEGTAADIRACYQRLEQEVRALSAQLHGDEAAGDSEAVTLPAYEVKATAIDRALSRCVSLDGSLTFRFETIVVRHLRTVTAGSCGLLLGRLEEGSPRSLSVQDVVPIQELSLQALEEYLQQWPSAAGVDMAVIGFFELLENRGGASPGASLLASLTPSSACLFLILAKQQCGRAWVSVRNRDGSAALSFEQEMHLLETGEVEVFDTAVPCPAAIAVAPARLSVSDPAPRRGGANWAAGAFGAIAILAAIFLFQSNGRSTQQARPAAVGAQSNIGAARRVGRRPFSPVTGTESKKETAPVPKSTNVELSAPPFVLPVRSPEQIQEPAEAAVWYPPPGRDVSGSEAHRTSRGAFLVRPILDAHN